MSLHIKGMSHLVLVKIIVYLTFILFPNTTLILLYGMLLISVTNLFMKTD